jgi:hypothetical protein
MPGHYLRLLHAILVQAEVPVKGVGYDGCPPAFLAPAGWDRQSTSMHVHAAIACRQNGALLSHHIVTPGMAGFCASMNSIMSSRPLLLSYTKSPMYEGLSSDG